MVIQNIMWVDLLTIFTVWRITSILYREDGPYNIFVKIRKWTIKKEIKVFDCFWCLSMWVSIPFALFADNKIIYWFGLSGLIIFIDEAIEYLKN